MKKRILALTLTFVLVFGMMLTTEAFGAVSASLSGGKTYIKGDSISMTLTYSGGNFGGVEATLSYDKNILEFVSSSGGTFNPAVGKIVLDAGGSPSLSITFTFKAKNTGSTTVSVVNAQGGTMDGVAFTNGASATVTVKDPPPPTPEKPAKPATKPDTKPATKPSSGTNGRGDFDEENVGVPEEPVEEIDPSVKPEEIEVTVGSKTYVICEDLKDKELPEGFEATKYEYGEYKWSIQVAESESSKHTLILLKDKESGKESWFFFDKETGEMADSKTLTVAEVLEYEKLRAEAEEGGSNLLTVFIALSVILAAVAAGLCAYIFRLKKKE